MSWPTASSARPSQQLYQGALDEGRSDSSMQDMIKPSQAINEAQSGELFQAGKGGFIANYFSTTPFRGRSFYESNLMFERQTPTPPPEFVAYHPAEDWADEFISSRGNEYFCEIDEDYLTDRFNLTGLNTEVQYYQYALDLVTDVFDMEVDDDMRDQIEKSARHLYGLVHARYIVTTRGLAKMLDKYKQGIFGKCPRVICDSQHLLPMGLHDVPNTSHVKLYCAKCEDIYNPKSSRHNSIDGAYFGSSFHNILFQVYPAMLPQKSQHRYQPRLYGFKVHASAALMRWQEDKREEMKERLRSRNLETGFSEEEDELADEASDDEEDANSQEGIDDMFEGQVQAVQ